MSRSKHALIVAAGLGCPSQAEACLETSSRDSSRKVTSSMVAHRDVAPIDRKTLFDAERGEVKTTTKTSVSTAPDIKVRCAAPPTYEFEISRTAWNAAQAKRAINISLDPKYTASPDDRRLCINVDVKNFKADILPNGNAQLILTLRENFEQRAQRLALFAINTPADRNQEAWCYSFTLPKP